MLESGQKEIELNQEILESLTKEEVASLKDFVKDKIEKCKPKEEYFEENIWNNRKHSYLKHIGRSKDETYGRYSVTVYSAYNQAKEINDVMKDTTLKLDPEFCRYEPSARSYRIVFVKSEGRQEKELDAYKKRSWEEYVKSCEKEKEATQKEIIQEWLELKGQEERLALEAEMAAKEASRANALSKLIGKLSD